MITFYGIIHPDTGCSNLGAPTAPKQGANAHEQGFKGPNNLARHTRPGQFWLVGFGWLALTLAFEFSFGLAQGKSWPVMLEAYTFRDGNLWPIVLVVTACAPFIAARVRRKATGSAANAATFVQQQHFRWLSGQDRITSFQKPTGYRSDFCSVCGWALALTA
ncbi:MAG: hypothetical protein RIK85_15685 [Marinobacter sp.]